MQVNTYVILGVRVPYEKGDDAYAKYEKFYDDAYHPRQAGMVVLFDGMNGGYIIIGHVLAVTDNGQHFDDPIAIDPPKPKLLESIKAELKAHFNLENQEIKYWVVSHYR